MGRGLLMDFPPKPMGILISFQHVLAGAPMNCGCLFMNGRLLMCYLYALWLLTLDYTGFLEPGFTVK